MIGIEQVIFRNMILDDGYMRKVLPFVKDEYFEGLYRKLYTTFKKYVEEYNKSPVSYTHLTLPTSG